MKGFSRANLDYMRSVAETWPRDFVSVDERSQQHLEPAKMKS